MICIRRESAQLSTKMVIEFWSEVKKEQNYANEYLCVNKWWNQYSGELIFRIDCDLLKVVLARGFNVSDPVFIIMKLKCKRENWTSKAGHWTLFWNHCAMQIICSSHGAIGSLNINWGGWYFFFATEHVYISQPFWTASAFDCLLNREWSTLICIGCTAIQLF